MNLRVAGQYKSGLVIVKRKFGLISPNLHGCPRARDVTKTGEGLTPPYGVDVGQPGDLRAFIFWQTACGAESSVNYCASEALRRLTFYTKGK